MNDRFACAACLIQQGSGRQMLTMSSAVPGRKRKKWLSRFLPVSIPVFFACSRGSDRTRGEALLAQPCLRLSSESDPSTSFSRTFWSRSASRLKYRQALPNLCLPSLAKSDAWSGASATK